MPLIKNTKVGNLKKIYSCIIICLSLFFFENTNSENNLVGKNTNVKILDKISSKNEWMFSSSPSIAPFDHPVYDIWLVNCY